MKHEFCTYQIAVEAADELVPIYVGSGTTRRPKTHLRRTHNAALSDIIQWARDNDRPLHVEVISRHASREEAYAAEVELIAATGRSDLAAGPLVNVASGGPGLTGWGTPEKRAAVARAGALGLTLEDRQRAAAATNRVVTREKRSASGRARARSTNAIKRTCGICGLTAPPGPMANHLRAHAPHVSERLGSSYRSGRLRDWIKCKNPSAPAARR
jgi:hypothetical protein